MAYNGYGDPWRDDEVETVSALWKLGKSVDEIARAVRRSRNSVIGKVHRLKLDARPSPIRRAS